MSNSNPVIAGNDARLRKSTAATVVSNILGRPLTGDAIVYHAKKGHLPFEQTFEGQYLFRRRDVVAFAEELREREQPAELAG